MPKFTKRPLSILAELFASEAVGGLILIATAVVALIVANRPTAQCKARQP